MAGLFSSETEGVGLVYCIVEDEYILDDVEARAGNEISASDVVEVLKQHVEVEIRRTIRLSSTRRESDQIQCML
jgi:hypothetical protein